MITVFYVITKSGIGGAQKYVLDLATHLPNTFKPIVISGPGNEGRTDLARALSENGIASMSLPALARDVRPGKDIAAFFALLRLFRTERPQVVHVNSSKAGGLGAAAARFARVPCIVFTCHGLPYDEARDPLSRFFIFLATLTTIYCAHTTVALSENNYRRLKHLPFVGRRVVHIPNGIHPETIPARAEARASLRALDATIPERGALVGTIAELNANKDLAVAIDAIAQVPDAHYVVIGEGELRQELIARAKNVGIADRIHLLGALPQAARYLAAFDAFLLTSRKEGLPYALLEAGAAGVPVVAVDIPGVRDIVEHEQTGLLVSRIPETIAAALVKMLSNNSLSRVFAERMRTHISSKFSLDHMIEATTALYREVTPPYPSTRV